MASMANSFDLLVGAESQLSSKKKKKQNKAGKENGAATQENGFGLGHESSRANGAHSYDPSRPVDVDEAVAILERAAREARSIADKVKLWKDWIRQASERNAKSIKYKDVDAGNALVEFRQVLVKSRALEISLESAVGAGLNAEREEVLTQLLLTFSGRLDGRTAQTLANSIVHLSSLIEDESLDVKGCAQRALYAIIASIKAAASPESSAGADAAAVNLWMDQVSRLGQTIAKEQGMLQKLAAAGRGAPSREAEIARNIFRLTGDQFDLLQIESLPTPGGGSADSYLPALDLLKTAISSKIQAVSQDKTKGGKGNDAANKQLALASLKREEAVVAQQAESVAAQIRTLEAQLRSLRTQQQELDDKRSHLQQRMRLANDPTGQGKKGPAHHQEELAVVDTIHTILISTDSHSAESDQIHAVQAAGMNVGAEYVAAGRQYLTFARTAMAEVPGKVTFCKQRLAQAERLLKLGSKDNQKIKDDADKLMADTIKTSEELLRTSVQVVSELNGRFEAVMRSLPDQEAAGVSEALRSVDELMADIRANYETVQVQLRPPAPAPVPVAAPAHVAVNGKGPTVARPAPAVVPVARPVSAAPVASTAPAPQQVPAFATAPAPIRAPVPEGPKTAFDLAAQYLANARPVSAPVRSDSPASAPRKPAPVANRPVATPAAPAASSSAPRQWGKPVAAAAPAATSDDAGDSASLPTPAEAFKTLAAPPGAGGPSGVTDEPKPKKKNNRPKA